jgi:AcrR family transcriptional regulator
MGKDGFVAEPFMGRRGDAHRVPTRGRILDAAWSVFSERGFDAATVTAIEARAGLAAGSGGFYRHFASKQDVLRAVVDREVANADAGRQLPPKVLTTDARSALIAEFQRRLEGLSRLQPLMALLAREQQHLGDARERVQQLLIDKNLSLRAEILRTWMDQGAIPLRDPEVLATVIVSALTGYRNAYAFFGAPPGGAEEATFAAMLADLVLGDADGVS